MKYTIVFNYTCGTKQSYGSFNIEGTTPEDAIRHLNPSNFEIYKDIDNILLCESKDVVAIIHPDGSPGLEVTSIGMYTYHVNAEINIDQINNPAIQCWSFYDKHDKELF